MESKKNRPLTHLGLFEGIGGFSLAAKYVGWETLAWCEWNEFGQRVLKHHFPEAEGFGDITKSDFTKYANRIDVLTGGFPCQPYSLAGKRKGKDDSRHLWPEMLRIIREVQPTWVVGENVYGLVNWNEGLVFEEVSADLENEGYEVQPYILPAVSVGAVHRRDRVWFVAHSRKLRLEQREASGTMGAGQEEIRGERNKPALQSSSESSTKDATNSNSDGRNGRNSQHEVFSDEGGFNALNDPNENDGQGPSSNSDNERLEREASIRIQDGQRRRNRVYDGEFAWVGGKEYWDNFPTQSPVRCGDDGIPDRMVDITIPRWRKEALMALGNAVVPQVVIALFNTINEYNKTTSSS